MPQQELLKKVIKALEDAKLEYMVTGSVASSLQGEPRSTHDIDLVISVQKSAVKKLVKAFPPPDFHLDEDTKGMFNLINIREGDKVDFWILTNEPFDKSRFSRKYEEEVMGIKMQVSSPEDTILMKLKWAKLSGGSEKQFTDALRVYEVQSEKLDREYLESWARELNIESLWRRLLAEAEIK